MGLQPVYNVGDDVSISCSTDLSVNRISWFNGTGDVIDSTESSSLTLTLSSITASMNGARFTCLVQSMFGNEMEDVVLLVEEAETTGVNSQEPTPETNSDQPATEESPSTVNSNDVIVPVVGVVGGLVVLLLILVGVLIIFLCTRKCRR
jgi:ribosomal protein L12E/L44/L45/RPP1/RPP2